MEKKPYTIELSGAYSAKVERMLSDEEYALVKDLCDNLDTGEEGMSIYDGWNLNFPGL